MIMGCFAVEAGCQGALLGSVLSRWPSKGGSLGRQHTAACRLEVLRWVGRSSESQVTTGKGFFSCLCVDLVVLLVHHQC